MASADKTYAVVTTTIRVPRLLEAYLNDAKKFGRKIAQVVVAGDKKTPPAAAVFCKALSKKSGIPVIYLSPADQDHYLEKYPRLKKFLPWNCIQRRNVALLYAYEKSSADILVTLDDDNFLSEPDYFRHHSHLGNIINIDAASSSTGWWNVCEMLKEKRGYLFYHRGYPLSKRWLPREKIKTRKVRGRAVVNAGLWLDDPDVDALTRLAFPVCATGRSLKFKNRKACDSGTWCPFNSQNTAMVREILPAYFLAPFIGRFDDIWASYIVRRISDHLGHYVTYGSPLVLQKRNPHDYMKDFADERFGLSHNEVFLEALLACPLKGKTYQECYAQMAVHFPRAIRRACRQMKKDHKLFETVNRGFRIWSEIFSCS